MADIESREFWQDHRNDLVRIIQESVPGKQITMAHIISSPDPIMYQKLGLDPKVDYHNAAIGIMAITPYETAIIAADLCMKFSPVKLGFLDRFSGTLIVTGLISDVKVGFERVLDYTSKTMNFTVCEITNT
ncbi:MAG: BMC domain-containing protein [Lachnospiraceae bacterium]|nr:BMC domain-containing protein [Lachnospiraceae bacterium]